MATIINERRIVDENITKFEERMNSKVIRFVDHTPVYTEYYHIINTETTTDDGYVDIESLVGARSPIRYQKINQFPLYGIESLVPQIQDADYGLDSTIEGDAIIMPGTIKPLQNSFFIINHVKIPAIFRVTEIAYDNVRPDNYYQIHFRLEFIDEERIKQLEAKVLEDCECVLENIGSENRCVIKSKDYIQLEKIHTMYSDMVTMYLELFYNATHNSVLTRYGTKHHLYDPFLSHFININDLFARKNSLQSSFLTDQFGDPLFSIKYERSVYRWIEKPTVHDVSRFPYILFPAASNPNSTFHFYYDYDIIAMDVAGYCEAPYVNGMEYVFDDKMVEAIQKGEETGNPYVDLLIKHVTQKEISIYDIELDFHRELAKLHSNVEMYRFTPIILYIIKQTLNNF